MNYSEAGGSAITVVIAGGLSAGSFWVVYFGPSQQFEQWQLIALLFIAITCGLTTLGGLIVFVQALASPAVSRRGMVTSKPISREQLDQKETTRDSRAIVPTNSSPSRIAVRTRPFETHFNLISDRDSYQSSRQTASMTVWLAIAASALIAFTLFVVSPCLGFASGALLAAACWGIHAAINTFLLARPKRLFCPACDKFLRSDLSWVCPKCSTRHEKDNKHSFLTFCKECGTVPSAYQCHHDECEAIIYLDDNYDANACAYGVGRQEPRMNRRREREEQLAEKRHENELLGIELDGTRKSIELRELKERWLRANTPQPKRIEKSVGQLITEEWSKRHQSLYELKSFVAKLRETARHTHIRDEEGLQEALSDIEDFYEAMYEKLQGRA